MWRHPGGLPDWGKLPGEARTLGTWRGRVAGVILEKTLKL